jgi:hypothetical protein
MENTNERIRALWSRQHSHPTPEPMSSSRPMRPSYGGIPNFSFPVPPSPLPLRDYNMEAQQRRYRAEDAAEAGSKRSHTNMLTEQISFSRHMRPSYGGIPNSSSLVPPSPLQLRDYNMETQQRRYRAGDAAEAGSKRSLTNMLTSEETYDKIVNGLMEKLNMENDVKRSASNMTKAKAHGVVLQPGAMAALELSLRDPMMQQVRNDRKIKEDVAAENFRHPDAAENSRHPDAARYYLERRMERFIDENSLHGNI